ncbi:MAG: family 16 glycoside hydrolase [Bacteroidales bacterium]
MKTNNMKVNRTLLTVLMLLLLAVQALPQDNRTLDTKVADLLARMPSNDIEYTNKLVTDFLSLGDAGIRKVCNQVLPSGSADDVRPRFAIESLSRYLSKSGKSTEKETWEKICISYAVESSDYTVKDFFMKQLQLVGSDASVEAVKGWLKDRNLCEPAVAVIGAVNSSLSEKVLAESLSDHNLPCAATVMNTLARSRSKLAVDEYIKWSASSDKNTIASALNALAVTGEKVAMPVLLKAAKAASYRWEHSGAMASLLTYADAAGKAGDRKSMESVCKKVIDACNEKNNIQYKTGAIMILADQLGKDAMTYILKAASHPDKTYRNASIDKSLGFTEPEITSKWIDFYAKATADAKPEIVRMLGNRGDKAATGLVATALKDNDQKIRMEAAPAIVKLKGKEAIDDLVAYLVGFTSPDDQEVAKTAIMTIADNSNLPVVAKVIASGSAISRKSAIELLAWSRNNAYFNEVLKYASDQDNTVKSAACKALVSLASAGDQDKLIDLIRKTDDPMLVGDLQAALSVAASGVTDPGKRSSSILKAIESGAGKLKFIPVLANTGGPAALATVLKEFEAGDAATREICFKALTTWKDVSASSALFEIIASGNKTYEGPAFDGYLKQVKASGLPDDQQLLLYRKVMPFALSADRKSRILTELANVKTYLSLFFTATWLDDPEVASVAARSAMFIALPGTESKTGMYGSNVREILTKAIPLLKGPESDYERELIRKYLASMSTDEGFVKIFNGRDLSGWQGLAADPIAKAKMKPAELARKQAEANKKMMENWSVKDGLIWFNGNGDNLCSIKQYTDFEMLVDWKITRKGDSGIYLRGSPQVQIWDTSRVEVGAQVGSGGLYNNQKNPSKPLKVADNQVGEWNTFRIVMIGEKVSVWLNGILVVDDVVLENYWDRSIPIFPSGSIELQAHGNELAFRDVYVREINEKEYNLTNEEKAQGFVSLFNGRNLDNWIGDKQAYVVEDGMIVIRPDKGSGGNLYTAEEYSDFVYRFEFQLTPAANNGLGIRAPLTGDAAYVGMELQILDDTAPVYANLQPYQYHGSVYGVIPSKRGFLKPVGEWNYEEVEARGTHIRITLNGTVIVDGDIAGPRDNGTMDHNEHPGLKNKSGHIGYLGHGSVVKFRNIRLLDLTKK